MSNKPLVAIVDDDEPMRRATSNLLESAGFATATFPDAEAFLGSGRRHGVACLVTDMQVHEVARALFGHCRRNKRFKGLSCATHFCGRP